MTNSERKDIIERLCLQSYHSGGLSVIYAAVFTSLPFCDIRESSNLAYPAHSQHPPSRRSAFGLPRRRYNLMPISLSRTHCILYESSTEDLQSCRRSYKFHCPRSHIILHQSYNAPNQLTMTYFTVGQIRRDSVIQG